MRLSKLEEQALKAALSEVTGEVYLFGSRVDEARKGGDVYEEMVETFGTELQRLKVGLSGSRGL
jgi:hypothetical protein